MPAKPSNFISHLKTLSLKNPKSLALPESHDPRVIQAGIELISDNLVRQIVFFSERSQTLRIAKENSLDLESVAHRIRWAGEEKELCEKTSLSYQNYLNQRQRQVTAEQIKAWGSNPINQAAYLVGNAELDAGLAGCVATTADVIRAALIHIGLAPGQNTISGSFAMVREQHALADANYMFADCGVVIEPTAAQLVDIAAATVKTFCQLFPEDQARVAFLSFSTKGSAKHPSQAKVAEACQMFQASYPDIAADGELQFDAAISPEIAQRKSPDSSVAGKANCFIFPNLDAGNIAYKLAQRLAFFDAYGPILQGTKRPFSDLSRGASANDIKIAALITMLRS